MKEPNSIIWIPICLSIGISLGMMAGVSFGNLPVCICLGAGTGTLLGTIACVLEKRKK